MHDLIVVRANGRILVTHRRRAADLKQLLDALPPQSATFHERSTGTSRTGGCRRLGPLSRGAPRLRAARGTLAYPRALGGGARLPTSAIIGESSLGFIEIDTPETLARRRDFAGRSSSPGVTSRPPRLACRSVREPPAHLRRRHGRLDHPRVSHGCGPPARAQEIDGILLRGAFDLVTALEQLSSTTAPTSSPARPTPSRRHHSARPGRARALSGADIEPGVVFDARHGAIVLDQGVEVRSGTRLEGPCFVGAGAGAGRVHPHLDLRAPIGRAGRGAPTIFHGYANKGHDGFVGHSVVGRWVNLGAGTITST